MILWNSPRRDKTFLNKTSFTFLLDKAFLKYTSFTVLPYKFIYYIVIAGIDMHLHTLHSNDLKLNKQFCQQTFSKRLQPELILREFSKAVSKLGA